MATALDLDDIQGIVAFGYRDLRAAAFVLLGIEDAAAARAWLTTVADTLARGNSNPGTVAVNAAFSATGLGRLGLAAEVLGMFSAEFTEGMVSPSRSRGAGRLRCQCAVGVGVGGTEHGSRPSRSDALRQGPGHPR